MKVTVDKKMPKGGVNAMGEGACLVYLDGVDELGDPRRIFFGKAFADAKSAYMFLAELVLDGEELGQMDMREGVWVEDASDVNIFVETRPTGLVVSGERLIELINDSKVYSGVELFDESMSANCLGEKIKAFLCDTGKSPLGWERVTKDESLLPFTYSNMQTFISKGNEGYLVKVEALVISEHGPDTHDIYVAKTASYKEAESLLLELTSALYGEHKMDACLNKSHIPLYDEVRTVKDAAPKESGSKQRCL